MGLLISIDRSSLELEPLLITGSRATAAEAHGLWVPAGGYVRPVFSTRMTYVAPSAVIGGRVAVGATTDQGTWPLTVRMEMSSAELLAAMRTVLSLAVGQWAFPVTVTLDGVTEAWACRASIPTWPASRQFQRDAHEDVARLSIPVIPT